LSLLLLIALIDNNLPDRLKSQSLDEAPTFVFLDLFEDEVAELDEASKTDPRIASFKTMPMATATLLSANGIPADQLGTPPEEFRDMLASEFPVTFSGPLPEGSSVVEGEWWPADYAGPPLISVFEDLKKPFDLHVGDELVYRIFGEEFTARIGSFRDFEWNGGGINFAFVFSPDAMADLPVGYLGLMKTQKGSEDAVQQMLVEDHAAITFFPVGDALDAIGGVLNTVTNAVAIIGGLAVVSGLLVLAGAMAAGRRQREADAVVSKVLGATRGDVIRAYLVEYGMLGGLSALLAVILGTIGAWGFVTQVLELDFSANPALLAGVILSAIALTIAVGAITTWSALSVRPAPFLRVE
jgi:putative ABC transport system permease protein